MTALGHSKKSKQSLDTVHLMPHDGSMTNPTPTQGATTVTTTTFPRINGTKPAKTVTATCSRCGGAGGYNSWPGFTCFRCGGFGMDPTARDWGFPTDWTDGQILAWIEAKDAKALAARTRRDDKVQAKRLAQWADNVAACPELAEALEIFNNEGFGKAAGFASDVISKAHNFPLTANQLGAISKLVAQHKAFAARKAEQDAQPKGTVPSGRQVVTGTVVSTKWVESQYGGATKMLVAVTTEDGEYKVWGTRPRAIDGEYNDNGDWVSCAEKGDTVTFTATLEPSQDDPAFGFFTRPSKASIVEAS